MTGAGEALADKILVKVWDGKMISASINFELGSAVEPMEAGGEEPKAARDDAAETLSRQSGESHADETGEPEMSPSPPIELDIVPETIGEGITINNATSYDIDIAQLMSAPLNINLTDDGPQILIIHTHSSEAYTPDGIDKYQSSDTMRTEDPEYSVIRVGAELKTRLEEQGFNVIQDRGVYDYPSYSGSYQRSGAAVEAYLEQYPGISIVIDLHRDYIGDGDTVYKTMAEVPGESSAQIMLLAGSDELGLTHPNWRENLKLALFLQNAVNERYQTLMRPVALKQERYNMHLTSGSLILEVGSSGNTLQEALSAVRLFADAIAEPLKTISG